MVLYIRVYKLRLIPTAQNLVSFYPSVHTGTPFSQPSDVAPKAKTLYSVKNDSDVNGKRLKM